MKKFTLRVTESINHDYEIEAETEEEALSIYYSFNNDQLKSLDLDGQSEWDTHPWDITTEESE
jgi:hypothetical protein